MISTLKEVSRLRNELDARGEKLVLTNGVFDLLHVGHVRYLAEARRLGDCLVVAINADESVRELKGPGRPVHNAEERAEILLALESVDRVVVFPEKRATRTIAAIRPHVYAKGGDYTPDSLIDEEKQLLDELGAEVRILSLVEGKSTSAILQSRSSEDSANAAAPAARDSSSPSPLPRSSPRLAVLGSGQGSNCAAIFAAIEESRLDAEVALVLSDVPGTPILDHARKRNVPALHVDPGTQKGGRLTDAALKEIADRLRAARVDLIVLAGFMRILRGPLLEEWRDRILNIHPSLLPKHPGLHACRRALEAGDPESGCTIHLVDAGVDTGRILRQERVPIRSGDTPESLQARIQEAEHRAYPEVIAEQLRALKGRG